MAWSYPLPFVLLDVIVVGRVLAHCKSVNAVAGLGGIGQSSV